MKRGENLKKQYTTPDIEIEEFIVEDIIATSGDWGEGDL